LCDLKLQATIHAAAVDAANAAAARDNFVNERLNGVVADAAATAAARDAALHAAVETQQASLDAAVADVRVQTTQWRDAMQETGELP
jgi:hypothetical protein